MKTAVQDYIEKYITTPDIDIMSDINREFIYQEGGYSRFFPVLPGGYQPIQAPQGTPPEQGQHALWNSVSQNLQGLGRIGLGNRELKMRESQNKIDNELGFARLELAKQQLSQQDAQFKITTAFEQMRMSNTLHDRITNVEIPTYRQKDYETFLSQPGGVAESMKAYEDAGDDVNAQMKAANRINSALSNPNLVKWSMEKKRDDETLKDLEILAKADPLSLQYKNISEVASAVVSGQEPPPVDWVGNDFYEKKASEQLYNEAKAKERELGVRTREANIFLTQAKTDLAEIEAMVSEMDLQEATLEYQAVKAAVDAEPDLQKKVDIIKGFKEKVKAGKAAFVPNNEYSMAWMLGETDEERLAIAQDLLARSHTSNMKVHNSNSPVGPTNLPVTNTLSKAIISATGGEQGVYKPIDGAQYAELDRVIPTTAWYAGPNSVSGAKNSAVKITEEGDDYQPGHVKINSGDGSYSFSGKFVTKNYETAKKLGYPGKESDVVDFQYVVENVITTIPYSQVTGEDLRGYAPNTRSLQAGSTAQQSTTQSQPPYAAGPNQAWENINGKWILVTIKK